MLAARGMFTQILLKKSDIIEQNVMSMSTLWLIGNLSNYVDTVVLLFILNIICGSGVGVEVGSLL